MFQHGGQSLGNDVFVQCFKQCGNSIGRSIDQPIERFKPAHLIVFDQQWTDSKQLILVLDDQHMDTPINELEAKECVNQGQRNSLD